MEIIEIYKLWLWFLAVCENGKPRMKMVSVVNGQLVDKTASGNIQKLCISVVGRILWGFVHSMYSYRPNSQYVQWTCKGISLFYLLSLSLTLSLSLYPPIPHSLSLSIFFPFYLCLLLSHTMSNKQFVYNTSWHYIFQYYRTFAHTQQDY